MKNMHHQPRIFSTQIAQIFSPENIDEVYNEYIDGAEIIINSQKVGYYNIPCAFDIETSSFFQTSGKVAIMYAWAFGFNGAVIIGRTWQEFGQVYNRLVELLRTNLKKRLRIYVHNMAFDFQFFRKWLKWEKVFSVDDRKVVEVVTTEGIEFRCSYLLSGYSLAKLGDDLQKYKVTKAVGDLDYEKIRHTESPLTEKEIGYIARDVIVVMAYIQERIEADGSIAQIPLTKTGYVRRYCKNMCFYGDEKGERKKDTGYTKLIKSLTIEPEEYKQLKHTFAGGLTHCNARFNGKTIPAVGSFDFTSSYPAVMVSEYYPMGKGERHEVTSTTDFNNCINKYCCIFDVEFTELESTFHNEHILSWSKCFNIEGNITIDNGRVVCADKLCTSLTDVDFRNLAKFYTWKHCRVGNMIRYIKGYLPSNFVKSVLILYRDKTVLKGVEGAEVEYQIKKGMNNASFGMTVTDPVREIIEYTEEHEWEKSPANVEECILKYNRNKGRFLYYPWGVYITAYARRNLISGIYEFNDDYIYSDTDSVKGINHKNHLSYINRYNSIVTDKLLRALHYHKLPENMISPKTIEGITKPLGVWDYEGEYKLFKTLGAKRYMTLDSKNQFSITVSGLNKTETVPYLLSSCGIPYHKTPKGKFEVEDLTNINRVFDMFAEDLHIPEEYTGKKTHTYIDDEKHGFVTDYTGKTAEFYELSGIHLSGASYDLSLSKMYIDYLRGIKEVYE